MHAITRTAGRILVILAFLGGLLGLQASPAQAAATWTAYNDCASASGQTNAANTTTIAGVSASGELKDVDSGALTGVTAAFTNTGSPTAQNTSGSAAAAGSDAYSLFNGKADMKGVVQYVSGVEWSVTLTLSGLSPSRTYTFATSANRDGGDDYDNRYATFILAGDEGAVNASSSGAVVIDDHHIAFNTGNNTANGYIVRWTGIQPGADGVITITARASTTAEVSGADGNKAYAFSVFMLHEEAPTTPTILTNGALQAFQALTGTPSVAQTYTVAGLSLSGDVTITAPTGFELSTDNANFSGSLTLPQIDHELAQTTVYVRLNHAGAGAFIGSISHTSPDAAPVDLPVTGTVSGCITTNLVAAEDTTIRGGSSRSSYNYGGATTIRVNPFYEQGSTDGQLTGSLLKWDLAHAGLPTGVLVHSASLKFNVTSGSNYSYGLYQMRRAWVEGSNNGATGSGASWKYYDAGSHTWGTEGAQNTASDRYDANLWNATAAKFNTTGSVSFDLNSAGLQVIQGWLDGALENDGLTIQNYGGTSTDVWEASSSEATTAANRPALVLTYCSTAAPLILTEASLSQFSTFIGIPSAPQTYTVTALGLQENLQISAPAGYQLSTDNLTYSSGLSLAPSDGALPETTIYVRLYTAAPGTAGGAITHTSAGADPQSVTLSGTALTIECNTTDLVAAQDTYLSAKDVGYNNGGNTSVHADAANGSDETTRRGALLRWDLSSIPAAAQVESASLAFYVTDPSNLAFGLYRMRQAWVEGTGSQTASTDSANWNTYDGLNNWGAPGAASPETDRYTTDLWDAAAGSFAADETTTTLPLNVDGLSVLNDWVQRPADNQGFAIQNYTADANDALFFNSSEAETAAQRPTLHLQYCEGVEAAYTLDLSAAAHGAVQVSPAGPIYPAGTSLILTATPESGYRFSAWSGASAADPLDQGNGTWTLVMDSDKTLSATFEEIPVNHAPYAPGLVQPADAATGVATDPTLEVTAGDPDTGDALNVDFYGRAAGASGDDFTLVLLPDIQNEVQYAPAMLTAQMQWIVDQRAADNIVFVTSLGDLVNTNNSAAQYQTASDGFKILDDAGIPYSVGPGNHDLEIPSTSGSLYNTYFGVGRFSGKPWYGGYFGEPTSNDNANNYSLFSASGNDFILINLQYNPTPAQLDWADALLKQYSNRRGIVEQHNLLNTNNDWNSQGAYNALRDNPNLFLMVCGHMHTSTDGAAYVLGSGTDGHTIHVVMADYQDMSNGNGWLRLLRFSPANDMLYMTTYSPYLTLQTPAQPDTITTSPDQMDLAYDLAQGAVFTRLGGTALAPGVSNASLTWSGLQGSAGYEWYAVAGDGLLSTPSDTWTFTTGFVNHAPTITQGSDVDVPMSEDGDPDAFVLSLDASDPDAGDLLTWSLLTPPAHGLAVAAGTGASVAVSYAPSPNYNGEDSFTVRVADSHGGMDVITVSVSVAPVNDAPTITNPVPVTLATAGDATGSVTLTALDVEGDDLTWSLSQAPAKGDVTFPEGAANSKTFTYTPHANQSDTDSFVVAVADGQGGTHTILVEVTITAANSAPQIAGADPAALLTDEDTAKGLTLTAADADAGQTLAWSITTPAGHGSAVILGNDRSAELTYTPAADYHGPDSFVVRVADGAGGWDSLTVNVTVDSVNDAPSITPPAALAIDEDTPGTLSIGAADVDGDPLTWSILTQGTLGAAVLTAADANPVEITYTPAANRNGSDTFTVQVSDGQGGLDQVTVSVTIAPLNDVPVISGPAILATSEDTPGTLTLSAADADGDTLTWAISRQGAQGSASLPEGPGDEKLITYTPAADHNGLDSFDVRVSDGQGGVDEVTISVSISAVNDDPRITTTKPAALSAPEDTQGSLSLSAADVDGDSLSWSLSGAAPQHGVAHVPASGATILVTYDPAADFYGTDSFSVQVSDGHGGLDTILVGVTISAVNDAPLITEGTAASLVTNRDTAGGLTLHAVDADPSDVLSWQISAGAVHGAAGVTGADRTAAVTYTPAAGYTGADHFTVQAGDGQGGTDEILVQVTVNQVTASQTLALEPGWNLVSFYVRPADPTVSVVLAPINGKYDLVYAWDAASATGSHWLKYSPGLPDFANSLANLDESLGFWIHMTARADLTVSGVTPTQTTLHLDDNAGGWNLVGYPSAAAGALPAALDEFGGEGHYSLIYAYHAATPADPWSLFDIDAVPYSDLTGLTPGWGYWIKVNADFDWIVPFAGD